MKFKIDLEIELPTDQLNEDDIEMSFCGMIDRRNEKAKHKMTINKIEVEEINNLR